MTKIILFVIFLQVVFGILAKRKARKQAEEAARNPDAALEGIAGTERPSRSSPARTHTAWGNGHSEDESEEEWDDHHRDEGRGGRAEREARMSREARDDIRDRDGRPARKGMDKTKAKELGKDLLSQLAKELGLEIPTDNKPAPRPVPAPKRPQSLPQTPPQAPAARPKTSAIEWKSSGLDGKVSAIEAKESSAGKVAQARFKEVNRHSSEDYPDRKRQETGEDASRRSQSHRAVVPAGSKAVHVSVSATARAGLMDVKSLRNAFILKTILEKPLSLNTPGQIED